MYVLGQCTVHYDKIMILIASYINTVLLLGISLDFTVRATIAVSYSDTMIVLIIMIINDII